MAERILRVVACGSVDDGKSTLIGRLLLAAGNVPDDELAALADASATYGTRGSATDYALLLDGLAAEREQGITIDVAWRHLRTPRGRFLIADCPGHVEYTRNMATGASTADAMVLLVDAEKGLSPQTLRHTAIAALLGVRHVVLAINKMDRVAFARGPFEAIEADYRAHASVLGIDSVQAVPVAAADGDNVAVPSPHLAWHDGPTVLDAIEALQSMPRRARLDCLPVQMLLREVGGARWYAGTWCGDVLRVGARLQVAPDGTRAVVTAMRVAGDVADFAVDGDAVAVRFADEVDAARGAVLARGGSPVLHGDQFVADVFWFGAAPLVAGRRYLCRTAGRVTAGRIGELKHRLDPVSLQLLADKQLGANDIGRVTLALDTPIVFAPYAESRLLGAFLLVDPVSHATLGAGMIRHGLRRADNLHWQALDVDRAARAAMKGRRPRCIWFTGLSGAGKSTIANRVERALHARGVHTYLLDGDNVRQGLNRDLGFTEADRVENLRRVSEVARLMTDAGLVVLVSFISPYRAERAAARALFESGDFVEVFVDTPLAEAERRDPKGLYAKARRGELPNFTGIDAPYEVPEAADLVLDTVRHDTASLATQVIDYLARTE
ncbi:adenylyl-sulfate kinase [Luteimonas terrae]|uniref:adenylyl-sulfate kinase n=1 Tax=Luteimonas terrae TaxID=1530191 RepID=UPI00286B0A2E|nr:adenylyl-sulfate kinase [Luteimonas terrae]